jgi:hypothetical protein
VKSDSSGRNDSCRSVVSAAKRKKKEKIRRGKQSTEHQDSLTRRDQHRVDDVNEAVARHHVRHDHDRLVLTEHGVALARNGDDAFVPDARDVDDEIEKVQFACRGFILVVSVVVSAVEKDNESKLPPW